MNFIDNERIYKVVFNRKTTSVNSYLYDILNKIYYLTQKVYN